MPGTPRCCLAQATSYASVPTTINKGAPKPLSPETASVARDPSLPVFTAEATKAIMHMNRGSQVCGCNYTRHAHRSGNVAAWTTRNTSPNNSVRDRSRGRSLWRLLLPWEGEDPKAPPLQVYDSSNSRPLLCAIAQFA